MNSLILQTAARTLLTLLLVVVIFVLLRGHNEPGGGFIAGLGAAAGIVLYALAFGSEAAVRLVRANPRVLTGVGLVVALIAAVWGLTLGDGLLQGQWIEFEPPLTGSLKLGTPLLFDVGVAFVVFGTGMTILVSLLEDT